jgi:threonine aldolase
MTHADISDADIATALRRIGPIDGAAAAGDGHRSPVRPGKR